MSTGLSRTTANALVTANLSGGGSLHSWVHPTAVGSTDGWSKDATNSGLYDATKNRRVITSDGTSDDVSTGIEYSYNSTSGWGQPVKNGTASLIVVFGASSL